LEQYSVLIGFLPWANRREVAITMLKAMETLGTTPRSVNEIEQLFSVIEPLVKDEPNNYYGMGPQKVQEENTRVSKLVHLLDHNDTSTLLEMLQVARNHICASNSPHRVGSTLSSVVFAALKLARRVFEADQGIGKAEVKGDEGSKESGTKEEADATTVESTDKPEEAASATASDEETKPEPAVTTEAVAEGSVATEDAPAPSPEEEKPEPSVDTKALLDSLTGGQDTPEEENASEPKTVVPAKKLRYAHC